MGVVTTTTTDLPVSSPLPFRKLKNEIKKKEEVSKEIKRMLKDESSIVPLENMINLFIFVFAFLNETSINRSQYLI